MDLARCPWARDHFAESHQAIEHLDRRRIDSQVHDMGRKVGFLANRAAQAHSRIRPTHWDEHGTGLGGTMRDSEWMTAEALQGTLGIGRSTFYRRVQSGEIEHAEIGGSKLFRPRVHLSDPSQSVPVPRNGTGQPGTTRDAPPDESGLQDRAELLALVSGYEARIDSLLVERQAATVEAREALERAAALAVELETERGRSALSKLEAEHARQLAERDREREAAAIEAAKLEAERAATEARERAAALSAEVERARLELEHARKLADLEIGNLESLARTKLADAERIAREERQRREGAEAQLAAARALESLPWWRFGQRRQVRALLASIVLGVSSCTPATPPSRYDDCAKATDPLILDAIDGGYEDKWLKARPMVRALLTYQCVSGVRVNAMDAAEALIISNNWASKNNPKQQWAFLEEFYFLISMDQIHLRGSVDSTLSGSVDSTLSGSVGRY